MTYRVGKHSIIALVVVSFLTLLLLGFQFRQELIKSLPETGSQDTEIIPRTDTPESPELDIIIEPETSGIDWEGLELEILDLLGTDSKKYGIYIEDLETGEHLGINENIDYPPASVYKLPLAIIVLTEVDQGRTTLDTKYLITDEEKTYEFDALSRIEGDYNLSLNKILEYLIVLSDNTAMSTLEHRFGGVYELQDRMEEELGIDNITRLPLKSKAEAIGYVLRGLYFQDFLSEELNEYLLNYLKNTAPHFQNRIVAGVPDDVEVAHKVGDLGDVSNDAGIVYGEERDYIIVVINDDINPATAKIKIQKISEITYNYLNNF